MISKNGRTSLFFVVMVVLLALTTAAASNASGSGSKCVVKFVCGDADIGVNGERAVPGDYRTSINVLNLSSSSATYTKKLSYTTPCDEDEESLFELPGGTSATVNGTVGAGLAFDVDCREVFEEFDACGAFAEGFLILTSNAPLKVTAVYTAGGEGGASSIDVNEVACTGGTSSSGDDDDDD